MSKNLNNDVSKGLLIPDVVVLNLWRDALA